MKKIIICFSLIFSSQFMTAQSTTYDLPVNELPSDVKSVLVEYVDMLRNSASLDEMAINFTKIAGGGLVNESATSISLRSTIKEFSLKKDYTGIKLYAYPIVITRVNSNPTASAQGFGESAIMGRVYKIWIGKADGQPGMPAPISILVPQNHSSIKTPKIVGIGSL
jgi:hypothetical protein